MAALSRMLVRPQRALLWGGMLLGLLFGRDAIGYVGTSVAQLRQHVKDSVPVEFEIDSLDTLADFVCDSSRKAVLAEIAKLPKGTWHNSMTVDGYDEPVTLKATLTISETGIHVDFTGTTVMPTIWADAGLVPCAEVGMRQTVRCVSPRAR